MQRTFGVEVQFFKEYSIYKGITVWNNSDITLHRIPSLDFFRRNVNIINLKKMHFPIFKNNSISQSVSMLLCQYLFTRCQPILLYLQVYD